MLSLLFDFLLYYFCLLGFAFLTTVSLILLGSGWGSLPHKYLKVVLYIQQLFAKVYDSETDDVPWIPDSKDKSRCVLSRSQSTITAADMQFQFDIDKENLLSVFDVGIDLAASGLQAVVQVCSFDLKKTNKIFPNSPKSIVSNHFLANTFYVFMMV